MSGRPKASLSTIRVRLTAALALALLPILLLGVLQSVIAFHREDASLKENLAAAAQRSAASARARLESTDILLETLAPGSVGFQCAQRLAQVTERIPGYANLIRFDRNGRVACAAGGVPPDPGRTERPWFRKLAGGDPLVVVRDTGLDPERAARGVAELTREEAVIGVVGAAEKKAAIMPAVLMSSP